MMKHLRYRYVFVLHNKELLEKVSEVVNIRVIHHSATTTLLRVSLSNLVQLLRWLNHERLRTAALSGTIRGCYRQIIRRGYLLK